MDFVIGVTELRWKCKLHSRTNETEAARITFPFLVDGTAKCGSIEKFLKPKNSKNTHNLKQKLINL